MRRYAIDTQYNLRDLGGYSTADNRNLAWGKVLRSDCPVINHGSDVLQFETLKITDVIDLRTSEQAKKEPSCFRGVSSVTYHNVSFENGNGTPKREESIPFTYLKMMEESGTINRILQIISEAKGTVLFHCAVGKDRTGIVAAILLGICGVGTEDIIADYQVSETYIHSLVSEYRRNSPSLPEWFGRSKPEYMRECLGRLMDKYGTFDDYIRAKGISDTVIKGIRAKLIL